MEEELKLQDQFLQFYLVTSRLQKCKHHVSNCSGLFFYLKKGILQTCFCLNNFLPLLSNASNYYCCKNNQKQGKQFSLLLCDYFVC